MARWTWFISSYEQRCQSEVVTRPTEFFNSVDTLGMLTYILTLKIGTSGILLRNLIPPRLCNSTRLSVNQMMNDVIEATISNRKFKRVDTLPGIPTISSVLPFWIQTFEVFAIIINKAHGKSMQVCGLDSRFGEFVLLTWASSRLGKPSDLFVHALVERKTNNIVFPHIPESFFFFQ